MRTHKSKSFCLLFLLIVAMFPLLRSTQSLAAEGAISPGESLTLKQAIEIGLKNQPAIMAGTSTYRAGLARIGQAKSPYYPQITASGGYSRVSTTTEAIVSGRPTIVNGQIQATAPTTERVTRETDQYTSSLGLNQLVYDFGKTSGQVKVQDLNTRSSRFDLANTKDVVVLNIRRAYYDSLQAERNREVARQAVHQFEEHLEQAKGFYEVGTKPKFDVTRAEVDLSNAKLNLIRAENQVRLARVALNNGMGVADAPEYTLQDRLAFAQYGLRFEEAVGKAYSNRPDLQSLIARRDAAKASVTVARKGYYPTVNGSANYSYTGAGFPLNNNWNYGLNLNVPIFSGYLTTYQVSEAQESYNKLSADERTLRLDIYSQVETAYSSLRQAEESITNAGVTVRQAKENLELATGRYNAGVGNPIEVTDAVVALANAEVAYTQALADHNKAQADIEKATGVKE